MLHWYLLIGLKRNIFEPFFCCLYTIAQFRSDINSLQKDLDDYIIYYNNKRTHQGKRCQGKTPMQTFIEGKEVVKDKNIELERSVA